MFALESLRTTQGVLHVVRSSHFVRRFGGALAWAYHPSYINKFYIYANRTKWSLGYESIKWEEDSECYSYKFYYRLEQFARWFPPCKNGVRQKIGKFKNFPNNLKAKNIIQITYTFGKYSFYNFGMWNSCFRPWNVQILQFVLLLSTSVLVEVTTTFFRRDPSYILRTLSVPPWR